MIVGIDVEADIAAITDREYTIRFTEKRPSDLFTAQVIGALSQNSDGFGDLKYYVQGVAPKPYKLPGEDDVWVKVGVR